MHRAIRPLPIVIGHALLLLQLLVTGLSFASPGDLPMWRPGDMDPTIPFSDRRPVAIVGASPQDARAIIDEGIDVESVRQDGSGVTVLANVNRATEQELRSRGLSVHLLRNLALEAAREIPPGSKDDRAWPTWDQFQAEMQATAAAHPQICRLVSAGQSVQGRNIWFMHITDNPDVDENEPEFRYTSTVHGDEVTGMEMCRRLIHLLTDSYGIDPTLTSYVDGIDIWINPIHNPDGFVAISRYNAHGVDINRDFPDPVTDPVDDPAGREPETQALMYLGYAHRFILSANYHGGALVVNYPWDCKPEYTPDDVMIRNFSLGYSSRNPPMYNNPEFPQGVVIGWEWYIVHGGIQDWCYNWRSDIDVTIEVSNTKRPSYDLMDQFWTENRDAMLYYMSRVLIGVRGVVRDAVTQAPLDATVDVVQIGKSIRTDPDLGDYHRMLEPGTYTLSVQATGYLPQTVPGVIVTDGPATVRNIDMQPLPSYELSGVVTDASSGSPLGATIEVYRTGTQELVTETQTDPIDGSYALTAVTAVYDVRASAAGHVPETRQVNLNQNRVENFALDSSADRILLIQDGTQTRMATDLTALGYTVMVETAAVTNPGSWGDYRLLVWSAGSNADPIANAVMRTALESHVANGHGLLIEGGQIGYDVFRTPGYPSFGQNVLHASAWDANSAGDLPLVATGHALATTPHVLPTLMDLGYLGSGDQDAVRPRPEATLVYGTQSYPSDAGILAYDDDPTDPTRGQVVYLAFYYNKLTDTASAAALLDNCVHFLDRTNPASVGDARAAASLALAVHPNPARSTLRFAIANATTPGVLAIFDAAGRRVWQRSVPSTPDGRADLEWSGQDVAGREATPGVYFARISCGPLSCSKPVIWLGR